MTTTPPIRPSPLHTPPHHHHHRLLIQTHIHIATLQLIAALLLTLMLLWHISTVTLVENYQMPEWWVHDFLAEHASGWRVGVWAAACVFVRSLGGGLGGVLGE